MKFTTKQNWMLKVKSKYTYRIYENGNHEMSIEIQLTKDFKNATLKNFAIVTTSKENFERCITVDYLNKLFPILKNKISEYGSYGQIECNYLPKWEGVM